MRPINASLPRSERASSLGLLALALIVLASPARAQQACESDADCADDLVCSRVLFGADCTSGECLEILEQSFCAEAEPEPLRCDEDGRCPEPLYCDSAHAEGPLCAFIEPTCSSSDSECPSGFMCVDLEPLGGCELCDDTEGGPVCAEAPCAENGLNVCSPIAMSCESDSDCRGGFVCREVGAFDLQLGWDETWVGRQACLSVGLIAVQDGAVQGGVDSPLPEGTSDGGVSAGAGGASGTGAGAGGSGAAGGAGDGDAGDGDAGDGDAGTSGEGADSSASGGRSDGCSCSIESRSGSRALSLVLLTALMLGALSLRRWPVG